MLTDHHKYFNKKAVERMCPGERHAHDNCQFYKIQNFEGAGKFTYVGVAADLENAIEVAKTLDRPMVHCVSKRMGQECMLLVPLDLPRRRKNYAPA